MSLLFLIIGYNEMVMEWKTIKSVPTYEANKNGDIRRKSDFVKFGGRMRPVGGVILSPKTKSNGYQEVNLHNKSKYVHRLVAEAWFGGIPKGMTVNHKDGDKQNNQLDNLEIVTYSENAKHAYKLGLAKPVSMPGSLHPRSKTNEEEVLKIRKEHNNHKSIKKLEINYPHLSRGTLIKIVYKQTWRHI